MCMKSNMRISKPTIYLSLFLFTIQFTNGFHAVKVGNIPTLFNVWYFLAFYWVMGWWFINDSREHEIKWLDRYVDMGFYLYMAWIFILPYYLFKTRGRKAFFTLLMFLAIYIGAYFTGVITEVIFHLITKI